MRSKTAEAAKKQLKLTREQREILVGILLGDAHLETRNQGHSYRLKVEQSVRHEAYVRHLRDIFGAWVLSGPRQRTSTRDSVQSQSWVFNTVSHAAFRFYGHQFYGGNGKRVPKLIHRWLTPRGCAYWFMDDGSMKSRQSKGVIFNTQAFVRPDVERLCEILGSRFELQCSVRRQNDGPQIYVSGKSYERFVDLVDPFLISEMRYKVPPARRTHMPKE